MRLVLLMILALGTAHAAEPSGTDDIGYPTVAAALEDLKNRPGADVRHNDGWTLIGIESEEGRAIWSFTPRDHAAHPAVVKQTVFEEAGSVKVKMQGLCAGPKEACDELMAQFAERQRRLRERFQGAAGNGA